MPKSFSVKKCTFSSVSTNGTGIPGISVPSRHRAKEGEKYFANFLATFPPLNFDSTIFQLGFWMQKGYEREEGEEQNFD